MTAVWVWNNKLGVVKVLIGHRPNAEVKVNVFKSMDYLVDNSKVVGQKVRVPRRGCHEGLQM